MNTWLKINIILTVVCLVLFIASFIGGSACDTMKINARFHYDETYELIDGSSYGMHSIGCGLETCRYCKGAKEYHLGESIAHSEYSDFVYYYSVHKTYNFFESCINVFLISLIIVVLVLLISIACRYKFTISIRKGH